MNQQYLFYPNRSDTHVLSSVPMASLLSTEDDAASATTTPADATCTSDILDISLHPTTNIFAAGVLSGRVELCQYARGQPCELKMTLSHHTRTCRTVDFCPTTGQVLYTASLDKSVCAVNTDGAVLWKKECAHGKGNRGGSGAGASTNVADASAVNACLPLEPNVFATGDDDGDIRIWDIRQAKPVCAFDDQEDYIADMAVDMARGRLFAASGDGTLGVYNLKQRKLSARSEYLEDELLSVEIMKGGKTVVCGSQGGIVNLWDWGSWANISDRFPGHPESIQSIVKIDEDTLLTGSTDGLIRIINLQPNKLIGIVGEHEEDFPVERICRTADGTLLASISHDAHVKFWDVSYLIEEGEDLNSAMAMDEVAYVGEEGEGEGGDAEMVEGAGAGGGSSSSSMPAPGVNKFDRSGIPMKSGKKNDKKRKQGGAGDDDAFFDDL